MSLVGTPFPLNFLCGNAVPMRSRPTTPLHMKDKKGRISLSYNEFSDVN